MNKLILPIITFAILTILISLESFAIDAFITRKGRHYIIYKQAMYDVTDFCNKQFECTDKQIDEMVNYVLKESKK